VLSHIIFSITKKEVIFYFRIGWRFRLKDIYGSTMIIEVNQLRLSPTIET
jgi:hypothetical protein